MTDILRHFRDRSRKRVEMAKRLSTLTEVEKIRSEEKKDYVDVKKNLYAITEFVEEEDFYETRSVYDAAMQLLNEQCRRVKM